MAAHVLLELPSPAHRRYGRPELQPRAAWGASSIVFRPPKDSSRKASRPRRQVPPPSPLPSLLNGLPVEIIRRIVSLLPLSQIVRLRALSRAFYTLCSSPYLFRTLDLTESGITIDRVPTWLRRHARSLTAEGIGASSVQLVRFFAPLADGTDALANLVSLDLSGLQQANELLLDSMSTQTRCRLRHLAMRGCRRLRDGVWLAELVPNLETLDVSWSGLRTLPAGETKSPAALLLLDGATMDVSTDDDTVVGAPPSDVSMSSDATLVDEDSIVPWRNLRGLTLTGCGHLSRESLTTFLTLELPPALQTLALAWHTPSSLDIDAIVDALPRAMHPDHRLRLDLSRCDAVTLSHVADLERLSRGRIRVQHTAVLESDTVTGYAHFIELVMSSSV